MHTALAFALAGNGGTHYLGKSIDVVSLDAKTCLYLLSHLLSPRLCAENACLELELVLADVVFLHKLDKADSI